MRLRLILFVSLLFPVASSAVNFDACEQALTPPAVVVERLDKEGPADGKWNGKTVIFDTNVLLNDPMSVYKYPGAKIVIPGAVMNEIDNHKKEEKTGRAARAFSRILRDLIKKYGNISKPVELSPGTTILVDSKNYMWLLNDTAYNEPIPDNMIVATALFYTHEDDPSNVYLISDDSNVQVKASSEQVQTLGFEYEWITKTAPVAADQIKKLTVSADELKQFKSTGMVKKPADFKIAPNEFIMLQAEGEEGSRATVARYFYDRENPEQSSFRKLLMNAPKLPFEPKNLEQAMALDLLLDKTVELVISESPAGTGKTFMALMAGILQQKMPSSPEGAGYDSLLVTRTLVQIGKTDLGAFPGSKEEKLGHWNENYADAIKELQKKANSDARATSNESGPVGPNQMIERNHNGHRSMKQKYTNKGAAKKGNKDTSAPRKSNSGVELVAFSHLRGRSISDAFIVMDEAQNSSVHEIKTFLTRAGEGTKMVILGDASQIDLPYLNETNNGLSVVSSLFTSSKLDDAKRSRVGYVKLTEGVRSALAELAREVFEQQQPSN